MPQYGINLINNKLISDSMAKYELGQELVMYEITSCVNTAVRSVKANARNSSQLFRTERSVISERSLANANASDR